mgnify:CR=1 FL=1
MVLTTHVCQYLGFQMPLTRERKWVPKGTVSHAKWKVNRKWNRGLWPRVILCRNLRECVIRSHSKLPNHYHAMYKSCNGLFSDLDLSLLNIQWRLPLNLMCKQACPLPGPLLELCIVMSLKGTKLVKVKNPDLPTNQGKLKTCSSARKWIHGTHPVLKLNKERRLRKREKLKKTWKQW